LNRRVGGLQSWSGRSGEKNSRPVAGLELRPKSPTKIFVGFIVSEVVFEFEYATGHNNVYCVKS